MTTRNVLAVTSTATAALLIATIAAGEAAWLAVVLVVFLVVEVAALALEVRRA